MLYLHARTLLEATASALVIIELSTAGALTYTNVGVSDGGRMYVGSVITGPPCIASRRHISMLHCFAHKCRDYGTNPLHVSFLKQQACQVQKRISISQT